MDHLPWVLMIQKDTIIVERVGEMQTLNAVPGAAKIPIVHNPYNALRILVATMTKILFRQHHLPYHMIDLTIGVFAAPVGPMPCNVLLKSIAQTAMETAHLVKLAMVIYRGATLLIFGKRILRPAQQSHRRSSLLIAPSLQCQLLSLLHQLLPSQ